MFHGVRCTLRIMSQPISNLRRRNLAGLIVIFGFLLGLGVREYLVSSVLAQSQDWESSIRKFEDDDKMTRGTLPKRAAFSSQAPQAFGVGTRSSPK